jgi:hypothetical protein
MSRCGNSRHQVLSNDVLAMGMATAPEPAPRVRAPGEGVLFVYYGADTLVITATAGGGCDQLAPALAANPRLRRISL